jgi:hypothetical protein
MHMDMMMRQSLVWGPPARILQGDARLCADVADGWADIVITSPPYINNFDYADATRLEMTFLGEMYHWSELHEIVRKHLICSCSQHIAKEDISRDYSLLLEPMLAPIADELGEAYTRLEILSKERAGKKAYHSMILRYFKDMAEVFLALRRVTATNATVCFVIGDSAPYGVHVPVEEWLGKLAVAAGFNTWRFEKLRDRNNRWKNRKHNVPLHEGCLWIEA